MKEPELDASGSGGGRSVEEAGFFGGSKSARPICRAKNTRPNKEAKEARGAPTYPGEKLVLVGFDEKAIFLLANLYSISSPFSFRWTVATKGNRANVGKRWGTLAKEIGALTHDWGDSQAPLGGEMVDVAKSLRGFRAKSIKYPRLAGCATFGHFYAEVAKRDVKLSFATKELSGPPGSGPWKNPDSAEGGVPSEIEKLPDLANQRPLVRREQETSNSPSRQINCALIASPHFSPLHSPVH